MKKWQWELRKAMKRWKLAILVTDQFITPEQIAFAAEEKGIRNVNLNSFKHLAPQSPEELLNDAILKALNNAEAPCLSSGGAQVTVMSQQLLDHYRSWTGGWFIEYFEQKAKIIHVPQEDLAECLNSKGLRF